MNVKEKEELRLLKQYTQRKLKEMENTLNMLIKFAREDLVRLERLECSQEEEKE